MIVLSEFMRRFQDMNKMHQKKEEENVFNDHTLIINSNNKVVKELIKLNENNAGAYFYRGEIFYLKNDLIKARSEWRKTLQIDPSHIKAKKRIY